MLKIFLISYKTSAAYTCENLQSHATNCFGEITVLVNPRKGAFLLLAGPNILCQNFLVWFISQTRSYRYHILIDLRWS